MLNIQGYGKCDRVFRYFEEISKIPHTSGNTAPIAEYLVDFAKAHRLECLRDKADNVIIKKPATPGYENKPGIILQGHTDMVAAVRSDKKIDLEKECITLIHEGDFLFANGTTLGADDGVFMAYALAILDSEDIDHPSLEALFTSDEETGLISLKRIRLEEAA